MPDLVLFIFTFIAVIFVASLLFGGWLIFAVVRTIGATIGTILGPARHPAARVLDRSVESVAGPMARKCPRRSCDAVNPPTARYCRRCGQELALPQRVSVRRAAMW